MRQKLNLITFGVRDFAQAVAFYEEGLKWKKSAASQGDLALFSLGGIVLALHPRDSLAEDAGVSDTGADFAGLTLSYNAKSEQEVRDVLATVESLGGTIVKPAQKAFWGGFNGYFRDPEGHLIEVAYNPFWPLDDDDDIVLPG